MGQLVDAADGSLAAHYEYDPFGKLLVSTGTEAANNSFRFSMKYFDPEMGLYYYGLRYYSPELGRWTTRDPIGEGGGLNLYAFAGNNPIGGVDILGLFCPGGTPYTESRFGVGNSTFDMTGWLAGKTTFVRTSHFLTIIAMNHADCSSSTRNWTLSPSECRFAKAQTEAYATDVTSRKKFFEWLFKDYLYTYYLRYRFRPSGSYPLQIPQRNFHFDKFTDGYFAFGDARLAFTGTVKICRGRIFVRISAKMKVDLYDTFSFAGYQNLGSTNLAQPTAIGYRLETSGYLRSFKTRATWTMEKAYVFFR